MIWCWGTEFTRNGGKGEESVRKTRLCGADAHHESPLPEAPQASTHRAHVSWRLDGVPGAQRTAHARGPVTGAHVHAKLCLLVPRAASSFPLGVSHQHQVLAMTESLEWNSKHYASIFRGTWIVLHLFPCPMKRDVICLPAAVRKVGKADDDICRWLSEP